MMSRQLVAGLALAHGAAALVEGFVDVLVTVDVHIPAELFAGVIGAAAGDGDSGDDACYTIGSVISSCEAAGMLEPTVPAVSAGACLCCIDDTAISSAYASCASYAAHVQGGGPAFSSVSLIATQVFSVCSAVGGGICTGGGGLDGTSAFRTTTPTRAATPTSLPAACRSMLTIYSSCSEELDFHTARARDAASCFCHDKSGDYNTVFEDYASSCATFFRTAVPNDYSIITRLATICDNFPSATYTGPLRFTTVSTRTNGHSALSSSASSISSTSSPTSSPTIEAAGTAVTTSTSTGLAAAGAVQGNLGWPANLATFILSIFVLI